MFNLVLDVLLILGFVFTLGWAYNIRNKTKFNDKEIGFLMFLTLISAVEAFMIMMYVINDAHNAMMLRMENIDNVEKIDVM